MRIVVAPGRDIPYSVDQYEYYVRDETDTTQAVRDELVQLIERGIKLREILGIGHESAPAAPAPETTPAEPKTAPTPEPPAADLPTPRTGVEVVASEKRSGTVYHTVRDLRNGNLIKDVTRSSARKLWHYAITQKEHGQPSIDEIRWHGNMAVLNARKRDDNVWYDLAVKNGAAVHIYYGVTDSGLNEMWLKLIDEVDV